MNFEGYSKFSILRNTERVSEDLICLINNSIINSEFEDSDKKINYSDLIKIMLKTVSDLLYSRGINKKMEKRNTTMYI